ELYKIETLNLYNNYAENLTILFSMVRDTNKNIAIYFNMDSWPTIFTPDEDIQIKVYMCGNIDFSPVQQPCDIDCHQGIKCLFDYQLACKIKGLGLRIVNYEKSD